MIEETKRCPFCAEEILATAIKCKHCRADLSGKPSPTVPQSEAIGIIALVLPICSALIAWFWLSGMPLLYDPSSKLNMLTIITIIATSILVAIEANTVGAGSKTDLNAKGKKRVGPVAWFFMCILFWIVAFPSWMMRRRRYGLKNLCFVSVLTGLIFAGVTGFLSVALEEAKSEAQQEIEEVQRETQETPKMRLIDLQESPPPSLKFPPIPEVFTRGIQEDKREDQQETFTEKEKQSLIPSEKVQCHHPHLGIQLRFDETNRFAVVLDMPDTNCAVYRAGLRKGDVISAIGNSFRSQSTSEFLDRVLNLKTNGQCFMWFERGKKVHCVEFLPDTKVSDFYFNENLQSEYAVRDYVAQLYQLNPFETVYKMNNELFEWKRKGPEQTCANLLSYLLRSWYNAKHSPDKRHLLQYVIINELFLKYLSRNIDILWDMKESRETSASELLPFFESILSIVCDYYLLNYSNMPNVQEIAQRVETMYQNCKQEVRASKVAQLKRIKEQAEEIMTKYTQEKGGWRFLRWGMTFDEVKAMYDVYEYESDQKWPDRIDQDKSLFSQNGKLPFSTVSFFGHGYSLKFLDGKLRGVVQRIDRVDYEQHNAEIITRIKEIYPGGKTYKTQPFKGMAELSERLAIHQEETPKLAKDFASGLLAAAAEATYEMYKYHSARMIITSHTEMEGNLNFIISYFDPILIKAQEEDGKYREKQIEEENRKKSKEFTGKIL